jgi:branched-subunit amino acid transport protein
MNEFYLIAGTAVVTFAIRYPMLALSGRITLSPRFLQLLRYVPPTVLIAIVAPAVLMPEQALWIDFTNARMIGAIAAILIGVWRKNLLLTIVGGMAVFLVWQAIVGIA